MIHAIKLLNNYTVKSSVGSRKAYNITIDDICKYDVDTYMALSYRFNFDIININQTHLTVVLYIIVFAL
jgi:hypothetical protein